ncbi:MAG: glycosyltransferase [Crocinitomicaceae bacterium]|nr:glycosyltransferase [Crocinitomicaceae bacterium]
MQKEKERFYQEMQGDRLSLDQVTVLIPFRNEEKYIEAYLKSVCNSERNPKKYIFINDHSTDGGREIVERYINEFTIEAEILNLPEGKTGKKRAIRFGMRSVKTDFVLTMDADVRFRSSYFNSLESLIGGDMYILPVVMKAKRRLESFFEIDVLLANALNAGISGIRRPVMASGANFLFRKLAFDQLDTIEEHVQVASGDDVYLLRDFQRNGAAVQLITNPKYAVETNTPSSLKEFFNQRLRWVGKTRNVNDRLSLFLALGQSLMSLFFTILLIVSLVYGNWKWFMILLVVKSLFDMLVLLPYFFQFKRWKAWLLLPVYELVFPIYSLIILVLLFFFKPKWKGRKIYS